MPSIRTILLALAIILLPATVSVAQKSDDKDTARKADPQGKPASAPPLILKEGAARLRHKGYIIAVAFSPNGKIIATGGWDNLLRLWDANTGQEVLSCKGHEGPIYTISFSPDGATLVSGGEDKAIRFWDVATGKETRKLEGHQGGVTRVAFSPDGKQLVSGSYDQTVRLWDIENSRELRKLGGVPSGSVFVTFSTDGKQILFGGDEHQVRDWDIAADREVMTFKGHKSNVVTIAFSSDGRTMATGAEDGTVRLWELATGRQRGLLTMPGNNGVWCVAFSPDGKMLATSGRGAAVRLWDVLGGRLLYEGSEHKNGVPGVTYSPNGKTLATCSHDEFALLWDVSKVVVPEEPATAPLSDTDLAALWSDLEKDDGAVAGLAVRRLAGNPRQALPWLKKHLRPSAPPDGVQLARLIADLDSPRFAAREKASEELEKLAEMAGPALQKLQGDKPSLEVQRRVEELLQKLAGPIVAGDQLQAVRAVEVLERIGTTEAKDFLLSLSVGAAGTRTTDESKKAVERMQRRLANQGR